MITKRRRTERREVLSSDLDRYAVTRGLWADDGSPRTSETLRDAVRSAVREVLTDKQREVVEAHFFEGISQGEIARRLGVTQQVVQKRIWGAPRDGKLVGGAIQKLRAALTNV